MFTDPLISSQSLTSFLSQSYILMQKMSPQEISKLVSSKLNIAYQERSKPKASEEEESNEEPQPQEKAPKPEEEPVPDVQCCTPKKDMLDSIEKTEERDDKEVGSDDEEVARRQSFKDLFSCKQIMLCYIFCWRLLKLWYS